MLTNDEMQQLLDQLDKDGDGEINYRSVLCDFACQRTEALRSCGNAFISFLHCFRSTIEGRKYVEKMRCLSVCVD